jgi:hypothetical protein
VLQRMISVRAAESSKTKLVKLCPTLWIKRHESLTVMVELLDAVYSINLCKKLSPGRIEILSHLQWSF